PRPNATNTNEQSPRHRKNSPPCAPRPPRPYAPGQHAGTWWTTPAAPPCWKRSTASVNREPPPSPRCSTNTPTTPNSVSPLAFNKPRPLWTRPPNNATASNANTTTSLPNATTHPPWTLCVPPHETGAKAPPCGNWYVSPTA